MNSEVKKEDSCPICGDTRATIYVDRLDNKRFLCDCCTCGRFISNEAIDFYDKASEYDIDAVASYLFYNSDKAIDDLDVEEAKILSFDGDMIDNQDFCDDLNMATAPKFNIIPINVNTVKNWMPKTFSEKVDKVLLYMANNTEMYGGSVGFCENDLVSLFFLKRNELIHGHYCAPLHLKLIRKQLRFFTDWLRKEHFIIQDKVENLCSVNWNEKYLFEMTPKAMYWYSFSLSPIGFKRVDTIERNQPDGKNVFVAMKFSGTEKLRACIKAGIEKAGYNPILIDEVEHNNQIMPEILYNIRKSAFVVAELTHQNAGAYLEEGYALGYGKTVIQLCKESEIKQLHFDISQKGTVVWNTEEEIPDKLCKRIKATIE